MSIKAVREALATALDGAINNASVYSYPPPMVPTPAVIVVPDEPYLEPITIGSTLRLRVRFLVTCAVAGLDNPAALDQLEELCLDVLGALPAGAVPDSFSRPRMQQIGPTDLLTSDMTVEIVTNE
jgi:hypothetical protein